MATQQPLTQEKALERWTEYQRLISVGAYSERSAEHHELGVADEEESEASHE